MADAALSRDVRATRLEWGLAVVLCSTVCTGCALWAGDTRLSPDAVEYLSIAKNLTQGRGLLLDLRFHLFTSGAPPLCAVGERPLLYPILLAGAAFVGVGPLAVGAVVMAVCALLIFGLMERCTGRSAAWCAMISFLAWSEAWTNAVHAWADNLFLMLILLAILGVTAPRPRGLVAGCLLGLASLTRPEGMWVTVAMVAASGMRRGQVFETMAAWAATMTPYGYVNGLAHGSPFYASHFNHLRVRSMLETYDADYGHWPTVGEFLRNNAAWVLGRVAHTECYGVMYLLRAMGWVWIGLCGLLSRAARPLPAGVRVAAVVGLVDAVIVNGTWSATTFGDYRTYVTAGTLLMPAAWHGIFRVAQVLKDGRSRWLFPAIALVAVLGRQVYVWPRVAHDWGHSVSELRASWNLDADAPRRTAQLPPLLQFLSSRQDGTVFAAVSPWTMCFLAEQPAVILPSRASAQSLAHFFHDFNVELVLDMPMHGESFLEPVPDLRIWRVRRRAVLRALAEDDAP